MVRHLESVPEFPDGFRVGWSFKPEILRQKVNAAGRNMFPERTEWNREQAELLDEHCGKLMKQSGSWCGSQWHAYLEEPTCQGGGG